ncbi:MAG: hypothetical protein JSV80_03315 [Acidobacteriota bacterium]|nr:MAG: hypothetical protein JSV80_03315 [Acidobacteriota bacterium]
MNRPTQPPEAPPAPRLGVGRLIGATSLSVGVLLLLLRVAIVFQPALARRVPPLPFFDRLALVDRAPMTVVLLVSALLLMVAGWSTLSRRRSAVPLFIAGGWGAVLFTGFAIWPGDDLRFRASSAVNWAKRSGTLPPDGTFWDLVPASVYIGVIVFALVWLALLLVGTIHLLRQRAHYRR